MRYLNLSQIADRWGMSLTTVFRCHLPRLPVAGREGRAHLVAERDLVLYEKRIAREMISRSRAEARRFTASP